MKSNRLTKKLPYLIIFSIIVFVLTGCNNLSKPESRSNESEVALAKESKQNPVFKALAAPINE
jgi:hypothetical protein